MTTLKRVEAAGAEPFLTVQCDVCCPPFIATNRADELARAGWTLAGEGAPLDVCHLCNRRLPPARRVRREPAAAGGGRMPNLVVVGAAKCATNSLHSYLDAHPRISMSAIKEPQFFQDPDRHEWAGLYASYFDPEADVTGESSTAYTRYPAVPGVPENMAREIPDARLIYMVRDPVERAVSSYVEERMNDNDYRDFDQAFADLEDELNPYVAASKYALQLERYLAVFPPEQVLVVDMAEIERDPQATMRRIYAFLGVDPDVEIPTLGVRLNTREHKREYSLWVRRLRRSPLLRLAYVLPADRRERLLEPVRRRLGRRIERPAMDDALRRRLHEVLAPDARRLRALTGQPFADWSV